MDAPLARHFTWTTYGTWLPGDRRGWSARGDPHQPPDPALEARMRASLRWPPMYFSVPQRATVRDAIEKACQRRQWTLRAAEVRSAHVHAVVEADCDAVKVRSALRQEATRALRKRWPELAARALWTDGGWTTTLGAFSDVDRSVVYAHDDHHRHVAGTRV